MKQRALERQREVERHLAEQRAEEEKKAKRMAELQQQLKSKEVICVQCDRSTVCF